MNDDFLQRARRSPSAAFERQLRERLREQDLNATSRRRPSWRLLAIALLIGGSALATATYLTISRTQPSPLPTQPHTESTSQAPSSEAPDESIPVNRFITNVDAGMSERAAPMTSAQQQSSATVARDDRQASSSAAATDGAGTDTTRYVASTGRETSGSAATRPVRIVVTPDIELFAKDTSPGQKYSRSTSFEVDNAGAAFTSLCENEEESPPDAVVTSRPARRQDLTLCQKRYGNDVLEATLGHIAIVVTRAKSGTPMQLSARTLRLALMKQVPAPDNTALLVDNPYTHWNQIDPALDERRIEVLGPARDTPEFLVFAATLLAPACENNGSLDRQLCQSVREDGIYMDARFDANFVRQRLWSDPNVVAIMDYQFYVAYSADLLGSLLPGVAPTRESILNGTYEGARTLHAYVNRQKYRNIPKVSSAIDEYLGLPAYLHRDVMLPPDGFDPRRPYLGGPKLTEVKFE